MKFNLFNNKKEEKQEKTTKFPAFAQVAESAGLELDVEEGSNLSLTQEQLAALEAQLVNAAESFDAAEQAQQEATALVTDLENELKAAKAAHETALKNAQEETRKAREEFEAYKKQDGGVETTLKGKEKDDISGDADQSVIDNLPYNKELDKDPLFNGTAKN